VTGYAPVQGAPMGEPEVPSFVNEGVGGQRMSPFAAMPEMQEPIAPPMEQPQMEETRAPRSFMDGIPAYMRRK